MKFGSALKSHIVIMMLILLKKKLFRYNNWAIYTFLNRGHKTGCKLHQLQKWKHKNRKDRSWEAEMGRKAGGHGHDKTHLKKGKTGKYGHK